MSSSDSGPAGAAIEALGAENRTFPPPATFADQALVTDRSLFEEAEADRLGFWERQARELVTWRSGWDTVLDWQLPYSKWFVGGTANVAEDCLDRHVEAGNGDKVAYHWEGGPGDTRTITYADLLADANRFANVLKGMGVSKGDRVCLYMPMIPELPVAMLPCARIGAPHSVVFGGFSSNVRPAPPPAAPGLTNSPAPWRPTTSTEPRQPTSAHRLVRRGPQRIPDGHAASRPHLERSAPTRNRLLKGPD